MNEFALSIVIPSYNSANTIRETLNSIVSQNSNSVQIVVKDGGSTDGTVDILKSFGDQIVWMSSPDLGQADAINQAIQMSSGRIIGWLNADDIYLPNSFTHILASYARRPEADLVFGDFQLIDKEGAVLRRYYVSDWEWQRLVTRGCYIFSGATFFRRSVFDRFGYFDVEWHYCMDAEFFLRIGKSIQAVHIPEVLAAFRVHADSKTGSVPWKFIREGHRVRSKYAGGDRRLQSKVLLNDALGLVVVSTQRIRWSKAWSQVRSEKRL